jgi:putative membrane protein
MLWSIFLQIVAGIAGLFLADKFVNGVDFTGPLFLWPKNAGQFHAFFGTLVFVGAFLGVLNGIVRPLLNTITFPIRMITLNLSSLAIAILMTLATEIIFPELNIQGIIPLFWTTVIVWGLGLVLSKWLPSKNK